MLNQIRLTTIFLRMAPMFCLLGGPWGLTASAEPIANTRYLSL
jgi:hypothetical protein